MRVDLLTREYPPDVYGGAGVHVEYLVRSLRPLADVRVHCFGAPRAPTSPGSTAYADPAGLAGANPALRTLGVDLEMAAGCAGTDVVHSHTWYANLGRARRQAAARRAACGHRAQPGAAAAVEGRAARRRLRAVVLVRTHRAGGGRRRDRGVRRHARATCSRRTRRSSPDRVHVVHNGIDTDAVRARPRHGRARPARHRPRPAQRRLRRTDHPAEGAAATCCGRPATLPPGAQLVLLAGAPDTAEIAAEVEALAAELRASRDGVVWVQEMLPKPEVIQVLTHSTVFVCPSIYEPMGIVNLEAMACETAVVATATGGIPEVVADGATGVLVPIEQATDGTGTPLDPDRFVADLGRGHQRTARRPRPGRGDGPGRPAARGGALLLGCDRRAHARGLPVRPGVTGGQSACE